MIDNTKESGLAYATKIFQDRWLPKVIYWLGFRPLGREELEKLFARLSGDQLDNKLHDLQNLRVVNPVLDTEDRYSLTDEGDQLRELIISTGVF